MTAIGAIPDVRQIPQDVRPTLDGPPIWRKLWTQPHVLTALFLGICGPLIFRHALWVDEAQAFVIARDSRSIGELIYNMRYEGHPPLWHFLLWIITRFSTSIVAMQALHLLLAATTVYLVTRFSPFPLLAKILFPFGYFPLFEYGIISRNYQLVMLLTFAFCALWQRRTEVKSAYAWLGLMIALLCLSHSMGVIMGAGLGVMLLLDALVTRTGRLAIADAPLLFVLGLTLALGGAVGSAWLLKPPADYGYARIALQDISTGPNGQRTVKTEDADWYTRWDERRFQTALSSLADGLLPMPRQQVHFWDSGLIDTSPIAGRFGTVLAVVAILMMSRSWRAVLFYVIATGGMVAFSYLKFQGGVRHHGGLFIALLAGFWIAWSIRDPAKSLWQSAAASVPRRAVTVLLAVHVYSAGVAVYYASQVPFATGRAAAAAVRNAMRPGDLLVADLEFVAPSISAYVPGHVIHVAGRPETEHDRDFIVWKKGRPDSSPAGLDAARRYAQQHGRPMIWITRAGFTRGADLTGAELIGTFDGGGETLADAKAIMPMETFEVYRVVPPAK